MYLPYYGKNLVKIGLVDPEIICLKTTGYTFAYIWSYWTKDQQIFTRCSQINAGSSSCCMRL